MPIVIFLIGIIAEAASPLSSSHAPMDHVFLRGLCLQLADGHYPPSAGYHCCCYCAQAGWHRPVTVF
jgi:hypothetical protein